MLKFMRLIGLVAAFGCAQNSTAAPDVGAATDVAGLADAATGFDAAAETFASDVAGDSAGSGDEASPTDVGPEAGTVVCQATTKALGTAEVQCCGSSAAGSALGLDCATLKAPWAAIVAAADQGLAQQDLAAEASCTAAVGALGKDCSEKTLQNAILWCFYQWTDTAKLGELCQAGAPLSCAKGQGRCMLVEPPDGYSCVAWHGNGESCGGTQPCAIGLTCLEGTLTRAKTCGLPNSSCNLSDSCWPGSHCSQGKCEDDPPSVKPVICGSL